MGKLRIVSDGTSVGTKVFDGETGDPIGYIKTMNIVFDSDKVFPTVNVSFAGGCSMDAVLTIDESTPYLQVNTGDVPVERDPTLTPEKYQEYLKKMEEKEASMGKALKLAKYNKFKSAIETTINSLSMEDASDTPDFMLAEYLTGCLKFWDTTFNARKRWYGDPSDMDKITDAPNPGRDCQCNRG